MNFSNTKTSYGLVAKFLHWAIALLILGLLSVGFIMAQMGFSPLKLEIYALHKSFGMIVLGLAMVRVLWRFINPPPAHLENHAVWERALSKISHVILYAAMFAMPLSGWLMSSAGEFPNSFFGLLEVPDLIGKDEALFKILKEIHEITAFVILSVLALHMAGAFKHHILDRDETLQRMSFAKLGLAGGLAMAIVFGVLWAAPTWMAAEDILRKPSVFSEPQNYDQGPIKSPVTSSNISWTVLPEFSYIKFIASQYGQDFQGSFERFESDIVFDPQDLENANARIVIDISSIKTGSADRDQQAKSADWFHAEEHPKAIFQSERFESLGANQYKIHGNLTIRKVSQPLSFPFSLVIVTKPASNDLEARMNAELSLNRLNFGVGQGEWEKTDTIGGEIQIEIQVSALRSKISVP